MSDPIEALVDEVMVRATADPGEFYQRGGPTCLADFTAIYARYLMGGRGVGYKEAAAARRFADQTVETARARAIDDPEFAKVLDVLAKLAVQTADRLEQAADTCHLCSHPRPGHHPTGERSEPYRREVVACSEPGCGCIAGLPRDFDGINDALVDLTERERRG